jgi:predicted transcriptional regulator
MFKTGWGLLGRLEREVMDIVWRSGSVNVRDVRVQLSKPAAYTTVMTTLDRLFKKGLLGRERDGRAFVYRAALSRQDVEAALASAARPVLSNLVDVIGDRDDALLDELEDLVRQKRRQNREG